jgi:NDP-sugar pyrophosphorylase family protein
MKAMILAAGLGTRLRPLTNDRPKALVEIAGHTLLEIALNRLRSIGVHDVIINAHHFAGMVVDYLKANHNFGMNIAISLEEELLDTGGGLKRAAHFFLSGGSREPFLLHNVDIVSTIDLERMIQFHIEQDALATLAVQHRETSRYLLFDEKGQLCGRRTGTASNEHKDEIVRACEQAEPFAFCGIHVLSPRIFASMQEEGAFSIIPTYLRLAAEGENILAFRTDQAYWRDLGRPENIAQAARDFNSAKLSIKSGIGSDPIFF